MKAAIQLTENIIEITVIGCSIIIAISLVLLLYRILKGPTNPDRAVGLDTIGINLMALTGLIAIYLSTPYLNDIVLLVGIIGFLGTLATAKYVEKGVIIDRDMD
ncbi:Na(+)/H(+) antiporter subunit F1 [Ornithinibacillus bavariensis]|uniref:Na(+)/H(+) antiporter subunit F n=1 Tax=Ornithinibacillus bavariensis TaxID=545502 RepID=A0A919X7X1_9BACI|nr:Na(+)/H(+) antiporter subunit F1 [Ornithinibacillus bavariensis]GIO27621.1 Na(+)/H(+) antiporter subunit F [Ornithinibacillus bavariensis]HAM81514.1 Na(+)/H(+) antiporter subunit F1 [Ornithinibacillus sp.]